MDDGEARRRLDEFFAVGDALVRAARYDPSPENIARLEKHVEIQSLMIAIAETYSPN